MPRSSTCAILSATAAVLVLSLATAHPAAAIGGDDGRNPSKPGHTGGGASGKELYSQVGQSSIVIKQSGGGTAKPSTGTLAPVDPNWKPPACWYEPVATSEQLKAAVEAMNGTDKLLPVNSQRNWSEELLADTYDKGEQTFTSEATKNYNIGKKGMFWRDVVRKGHEVDIEAMDCSRTMFWQKAGTVPDDPNAPTPEILAAYAYDKIRVPDTKVELKPQGTSTVNLPTWIWLDKTVFKDVTVRAELPNTPLYAVTTAKPVALHLEPGTEDAKTFPASGDCPVNEDGSIGIPYTKGASKEDPPCGISYRRATGGEPYQLKASVTWEISWKGTGDAKGRLPNGTFETTQDIDVQEIQSINR
ncbi:hypothetical protein AB0B50_40280 [Streptomyces sp. NPDC041068]|uniref:hypothetical protein n=1 Tax=Streptomyces sp. NPDC041068 TaxID=3155130 RepID=UPI0034047449